MAGRATTCSSRHARTPGSASRTPGARTAIDWFAHGWWTFARSIRLLLRAGAQRDTLPVIDANYAALRGLFDLAIDAGGRARGEALFELSSYWYLRPHHGDASRLIDRVRATLDAEADEVLLAELVVAQADSERGRRNYFELLRDQLGAAPGRARAAPGGTRRSWSASACST